MPHPPPLLESSHCKRTFLPYSRRKKNALVFATKNSYDPSDPRSQNLLKVALILTSPWESAISRGDSCGDCVTSTTWAFSCFSFQCGVDKWFPISLSVLHCLLPWNLICCPPRDLICSLATREEGVRGFSLKMSLLLSHHKAEWSSPYYFADAVVGGVPWL